MNFHIIYYLNSYMIQLIELSHEAMISSLPLACIQPHEENRPQEGNRRNKACEPALHTHARQEVPKDELGTCEDRSV